MYSAADLIQAVQRKLRLVQRRSHPPGEFPPGWSAWFAQLHERMGAVTGATAEAMVAVLLARPPAHPLPQPVAAMNRWQVFASVWRQHWQPPEPQERGLRWLAGILSGVIHLLLGLLLLWLLFAAPRYAQAPPEGETVVQIEFIGEGTPEEVGGGPAPASEQAQAVEAPRPEPEAAQLRREPTPSDAPPDEVSEPVAPAAPTPRIDTAIETPALQAAPAEVTAREVPVPQVPPPVAEQRLTVSEPTPDNIEAFFLPPPTPRVEVPTLSVPELEAARPAVQAREVPAPAQAPARPRLDMRVDTSADAPEVVATTTDVRLREVPAPVRRPQLQARQTPAVADPRLEARTAPLREARLPMPARAAEAGAPASTAATTHSSAASQTQAPAASAAPNPSTAGTAPAQDASPGSGPRREPAPGGWATPSRADDWGASDRNVPGAQRGEGPGVFNSDGRVRLADTPGSAAPRQPPGTLTEEIADLDRSGTWLKRPPVGYEPTLFDRYWRPNETLLQEWVRRGVKAVEIPIPGTTKKISCAMSLLALGGACGISDPNLNEQPAAARPPPDIPFKPELQEDNGSLPAPVDDSWD